MHFLRIHEFIRSVVSSCVHVAERLNEFESVRDNPDLVTGTRSGHSAASLKVHKNENFFGFDFEFCTISVLVMHK